MTTGPRFEEDALISYGHIDNKPLEDEERGWVDNLHERLEYRLGELLGHRPRIWRDPRLPGNVYFADQLADRLGKTCVLVSVLSPGYLQSAWCMGELREFCRAAEASGGVQLPGGRLRVFKVVKTFVERERHPAEFLGQLGYEFYELDRETGRPVEYGQQLGRHRDQRYWDKLNDLAWDIKQTLAAAEPERGAETAAPAAFGEPKGTVYLAETSYDLREERDRIKRELQERGYGVLPDRELPYKSPEYQEAVREALVRAKLSVHLIGASYGIIPEGASGNSVVRLQNEVAAERSADPAFKRLIWLPERLEPREPTQAEFIDYLKTSADPQRGAELLQTTLEELKSVIQVRLTTNGHRPSQSAEARGRRKIYLIFNERDLEGVMPLNEFLDSAGCDILLPLLDVEAGDDAQAIETHKENLAACDAALVYYGSANQAWFDYQRRGLEKAAAQARQGGRPPLAWGVYVGGPQTPHKQLFRARDAFFVKNFGDFDPGGLAPFLDSLDRAGAEGGAQ